MNLDQVAHLRVKLFHQVVNVMEVVEVPAFGEERVAEEITKGDGVYVRSII